MSDERPLSKLEQKIAEAKANQPKPQVQPEQPAPDPSVAQFSHLIPESDYEPDPYDSVIQSIGIIPAYTRWCGKMVPKARAGQTESIMASCPRPEHQDSNPSAWLNTELNTWYCGGCQTGGDIYDIASYHFGIPDYRNGRNYGRLKRAMAESFGYQVANIRGRDIPYLPELPVQQHELPTDNAAGTQPPPVLAGHSADADSSEPITTDYSHIDPAQLKPVGTPSLPEQIGSLKTAEQLDAEMAEVISLGADQNIFPTLEWRKLVTPGTFLAEYMSATTIDDIAEEYHFWNALLALGLACGKDTFLNDSPPVYGNLFICLLGLTGDGKSRSMRYVRELISRALPYDASADYPKGVNLLPTPSSAEILIEAFDKPVYDVNTGTVVDHASVRGLVEFGEMAELTGKANRLGNTLKPTFIDLYDMKSSVATMSRASGIRRASNPFCSMFTSTQPDSLQAILRNTDKSSGFLNRWVFASGKAKKRSFFQEDIVELTEPEAALKRLVSWIGLGREVKVDRDAVEILEDFYENTLARVIQHENSGMLSRLPLLYKKLLLLLAVNEHSLTITGSIADKVISMHKYSVEAYGIPTSKIGTDDISACYKEIGDLIRRLTDSSQDGPSLAYIKKVIEPSGYSIAIIEKALRIMENMGEVEVYTKERTRGRPQARYRYTA